MEILLEIQEILNTSILKGLSVNPSLSILFFLFGYFFTEKLMVHECISAFKGNKAWAVFLGSLIPAVIYVFLGSSIQEVIGSFAIVNTLYALGLKKLNSYLP